MKCNDMLTAIEFVRIEKKAGAIWKFKCDCGKEVEKLAGSVKSGNVKSCGCINHKNIIKNDLNGMRFGKLTVLKQEESKSGQKRWLCQCDCGNFRIVYETKLLNNWIKTCCVDCIEKKVEKMVINGKTFYRHGMSGTPLHKKWCGMKIRCYQKNSNGYENYGGRGIRICDEWIGENGFQNFYDWSMDNGYMDGLTIDRIDVNGNYEPSNCRWVTQKEQDNNKRTNHYLEYNGEIKTIAQWSRDTGINKNTIKSRIEKYGWSVEETLTIPPNGKPKKEKKKKDKKKIDRSKKSNRKCSHCENYNKKLEHCNLLNTEKKYWHICNNFSWKDGI